MCCIFKILFCCCLCDGSSRGDYTATATDPDSLYGVRYSDNVAGTLPSTIHDGSTPCPYRGLS